jgi:hypothetical protein
MGSTLVNYYRKKDEKDDHMPKVVKRLIQRLLCSDRRNSSISGLRSSLSLKTSRLL